MGQGHRFVKKTAGRQDPGLADIGIANRAGYNNGIMRPKLVMVSGGFDPAHIGHLQLFREAKELGDTLIVVLNCDRWLIRKKGRVFMKQEDRAAIIREFRGVDEVYILETDRDDVGEAIEKFKPDIFANGGDQREEKDIPEAELCRKLGVRMVFNVGGGKLRSSSKLLSAYLNRKKPPAL